VSDLKREISEAYGVLSGQYVHSSAIVKQLKGCTQQQQQQQQQHQKQQQQHDAARLARLVWAAAGADHWVTGSQGSGCNVHAVTCCAVMCR
jgi:transcription initiation factor TFIID subunit TAF12